MWLFGCLLDILVVRGYWFSWGDQRLHWLLFILRKLEGFTSKTNGHLLCPPQDVANITENSEETGHLKENGHLDKFLWFHGKCSTSSHKLSHWMRSLGGLTVWHGTDGGHLVMIFTDGTICPLTTDKWQQTILQEGRTVRSAPRGNNWPISAII